MYKYGGVYVRAHLSVASLPLCRDSTSPQCAHCGLRDSVDFWPLRLRDSDWGTDGMDLEMRAMRENVGIHIVRL